MNCGKWAPLSLAGKAKTIYPPVYYELSISDIYSNTNSVFMQKQTNRVAAVQICFKYWRTAKMTRLFKNKSFANYREVLHDYNDAGHYVSVEKYY